jgi:putative ABC transport system permease protein
MAAAAVAINQRGQFLGAGGVLAVAVGLVLLIACVNLANLLLARSATREREMALRAALGAERRRLLRQLLVESLLLAAIGGAAGLALAFGGRSLLWSLRPPFLGEGSIRLALDLRVLSFSAALSLLTGVLFGLAPAIKASDPDLCETLKAGGRAAAGAWGRSRLRRLLVVSEVALAMVALVAAGLFLRSLQEAQRIDPGFETERLLVFGYDLATRRYDEARGRQVHRDLVERAAAIPGVEAAAAATNGPLQGGFFRTVIPEGREARPGERGVMALSNSITPDYLRAMGIPLLRGRSFTDFDREGVTRVAIASETMVERFWPGEDALGKRFTFFGETEPHEIVGIVRDAAVMQIGEEAEPVAYVAMRQSYTPAAVVHVRTRSDPDAVLATARARLQEVDPDLAFTDVDAIGRILDQALWAPRMGAGLLALFGGLSLILAAVGIFGVMSYTVSERTREFGVRMALGARPREIRVMVLRQGVALALRGIGVGLALAVALGRIPAVGALLFGAGTGDLRTYATIPMVLTLVAASACYLPARRATRVDPLVALRQE